MKENMEFIDEGLGDIYEYYVKRGYLIELAYRFGLNQILIMHYGSGPIDSLTFSHAGNTIVTINKFNLMSNNSVIIYNKNKSSNMMALFVNSKFLPFNTNTFNFVFNSGDINEENPIEYICEMSRVSKRLVLVFAPNRFHVGDIFLQFYLRVFKNKSMGKHHYSFTLNMLSDFFEKANLKIVESGGIDMPPWPSHFSIKRLRQKGEKIWDHTKPHLLKLIYILSKLEGYIPKFIKVAQAHVIYVLGLKTHACSSNKE